jgi:hypothetical protein
MKNYLIPAAIVLLALIGSLEPVPAADVKGDAEFTLPVIGRKDDVYCADSPYTYHVCSIEAGDFVVKLHTFKRMKLDKRPVKYK